MTHRNARLTVRARLEMVIEVEIGWTQAEVSRRFRVSRATVQKYVRRYTRFLAHDEANDCNIGDRVRIVEHRPLSKRKRWKVQETMVRAQGV